MGIVFIFVYLIGKEEGMVLFIFYKIVYSRCVCGIIVNWVCLMICFKLIGVFCYYRFF